MINLDNGILHEFVKSYFVRNKYILNQIEH
jgi:hypothetical protein